MDSIECPFPGYEDFTDGFVTLITTYPPPFIYIQDIQTLRTTSNTVDALLRDLSNLPASSENPSKICYARVDCVACFNSKLFYEAIINTLVGWEPDWEAGCANWNADGAVGVRWNENLDMFLHGLRAAHQYLCRRNGVGISSSQSRDLFSDRTRGGKGKEKEKAHEENEENFDNVRFVIVVERVERLKESLPELIVPLTRLAEVARIDLTVVFVSRVGWGDIRPPLGASPDPYYIDIHGLSKQDIIRSLIAKFPSLSSSSASSSSLTTLTPYHPALQSLYSHFVTILCDVCYLFTHDPDELQYIAAARWPGFCKPLCDEYERISRKTPSKDNENEDTGMDVDLEDEDGDAPLDADMKFVVQPSTNTRMRLNKLFNSTFTNALESLLPRLSNAADWAKENEPPPDLLSLPPGQAHLRRSQLGIESSSAGGLSTSMESLPRMSKFILLASFLASTNPAKSDIRIFGRGLDEKKRKRRRAAPRTTGKAKSGPSKIPQRLLGPLAFPLDRMLAILGALLEENDIESRTYDRTFTIPGEQTDMEISRVGVYTSVIELTSMRLLHRASPPDRLDGPPQFKSAISYDAALVLAKQLSVALNDLLWDPV